MAIVQQNCLVLNILISQLLLVKHPRISNLFHRETSLLYLDCTRFAYTQICSALINSLIRCYYDDIASTDAISERLRDVCPNLFSRDDAVSTKVSCR